MVKLPNIFLCLEERDKEILCRFFLFILTLEVLFILVRSDSQIEGMMVFGKEVKLTSFADDATYFWLNIHQCINYLGFLMNFRHILL